MSLKITMMLMLLLMMCVYDNWQTKQKSYNEPQH